jgi:branched-chain amino acid transport system permease protein
VFGILVSLDQSLGGGTGISLVGLDVYAPGFRQAYTFWLTLACTTVLLGLVFFLLRRRIGTSLQAVRDDEEAAASLGVNVARSKRVLFIVAAVGCGIAGALYPRQHAVHPDQLGLRGAVDGIHAVHGAGRRSRHLRGPDPRRDHIFYLIQAQFGNSGAWYFVGLGAVAIAFALFLPNGIWGAIDRRLRLRLLPVGYTLRSPKAPAPAEPDATAEED